MAFVDGSGTASFDVDMSGLGSEQMSSPATANIAVVGSGSLVRPARIKNVRALSSTRIRVDFTSGVDNNSALSDVRNYKIQQQATLGAGPTIQRVDVPSQTHPLFVELIVADMTDGLAYVLVMNSAGLVEGANAIVDGDMEAATTAAWTAIGGPTLLKTAGAPSGSGAQVLRIAAAGGTYAAQQLIQPSTLYRLRGWARAAFAAGATPSVLSGATVLQTVANDGAWHQFGPIDFTSDPSGVFQLQKSGAGGPADFDEIQVTPLVGSVLTGVAPVTGDGIPVAHDPGTFTGVGVKPQIKLVLALSATTAFVQFTEQVREFGDLENPAAYTFDGGLSVLDVLSVSVDGVTLQTSAQTEAQLYTLTLNGVILDNANNAVVVPANSFMLGFIAGAPEVVLLQLRMYNFLKQGLRDEDQSDRGAQFIERFFEGPQAIWEATVKTIFDIPKLWSVEDCPDEVLPFLKRIVGWTRQLDNITNPLDPETLRRLIAASAQFWKQRGPEDDIENILRLTTGERMYILNWFDLRMILDEAHLGEDHDGTDPWVLSTPGEGDPDAWTYDVRIVDSGVLNHQLVRDLCRLTRPVGERVQINYLGLLDRFDVAGDRSQWDDDPGSTPINVPGGFLQMSDKGAPNGQSVFCNAVNAPDWTSYAVSVKIRGNNGFAFTFYRSGPSDFYAIAIVPEDSTIYVAKFTAGVPTFLDTIDLSATYGESTAANVWYTYRVEVSPETPGSNVNRISTYFEGVQVSSVTDSDHAQGTIGLLTFAGAQADFDDVEMFFLPATTDFIDINT